MEQTIIKLLNLLDKEYPSNLHIKEIIKKGINFALISEADEEGLIAHISSEPLVYKDSRINQYAKLWITVKGYQLLNQVRTKNKIKNLNRSIEKFDNVSNKLSKRLLLLTYILIFLSIIIAIFTIIMTIKK